MSSLLFYKKPVPLDKEKHAKLRLKKLDNLNFSNEANSVPVAGYEFFQCSRNHPVVFAKNASDDFVPVALLSLTAQGHNLGDRWDGVYVPAYVRRYPFVLEDSKGLVMFDAEAPHLQEEEGDLLFDDEGKPSETLEGVMHFLETIDRSYRATQEFVDALVAKNLLVPCKNTIKFSDRTVSLNHLYVIDEQAFGGALSDKEIVEWYKKGWIAWSYAQIFSLGAIPNLVERLPQKAPEPAA